MQNHSTDPEPCLHHAGTGGGRRSCNGHVTASNAAEGQAITIKVAASLHFIQEAWKARHSATNTSRLVPVPSPHKPRLCNGQYVTVETDYCPPPYPQPRASRRPHGPDIP